jgi:peptidoglycan/LPS O-acetylase OafA/YrhL
MPQPTPTHQKIKYFPSLDILRFVAFMMVFVSHAAFFFGYVDNSPKWVQFRQTFLAHGDLGVTFFFVLSGFLITYILISEKTQQGKINIKNFYMRRVLRIWPVYFFTMIVAFWLLPLLMSTVGLSDGLNALPFNILQNTRQYPWYVFFLGNFNLAHGPTPAVTVAVLWSISVEEQFYLIWPLIVRKFKRKSLPKILVTVILIATIYRFFNAGDISIVKYSTFSVMSDIAIGCLFAWLFFEQNWMTFWTKRLAHSHAFFLYYSTLAILILSRSMIYSINLQWLQSLLIAIEPLVFATLFALIISRLAYLRHDFITGKHPIQKIFIYLGKISYGLYCYHLIVLTLVLAVFYNSGYPIKYDSIPELIMIFVFTLIGTIISAMASYHLIEKNVLKYKGRFKSLI